MKKQLKDSPYVLLGFRVNLIVDDANLTSALKIIDDYLLDRGWKCIRSSAGIHRESKNPHFHTHLVCDSAAALKLYHKESYPFNKYLEKNNLKIESYSIKMEPPKVEEGDTDIESAVLRFLRYPLKEGNPIHSHCINIDIQPLMLEAQAHWKLSKEQFHKDEVKREQDKLRWNQIVKHLDEKKPLTYVDVFATLIEYTREDNPPVTTKVLNTKTINYMKLRKLLTNLQLIEVENYGTKILLGKTDLKTKQGPPNLDVDSLTNEQLMKMAISGNYNL